MDNSTLQENVVSSEGRVTRKIGLLSNTDISTFCRQMQTVLHAGIPALEGLAIMRDDTDVDSRQQELLGMLAEETERTGSVAEALERSELFPPYAVNMAKLGERSGNLDEVMGMLADYYQREEEVRISVRNALVYPLLMSVAVLAVIVVLLTQVMPVFNQVFQELGTELSPLASALLKLGEVMRSCSLGFGIVLAIALALVAVCTFTQKGIHLRYKLGSCFRSVRRSRASVAACRFAGALSIALHSGLHPEEALELVQAVNEDEAFAERLTELKSAVEEGRDFSDALREKKIFSGVYAQMASIGFKAGASDTVMSRIAEAYKEEIDLQLNNRLAVVEPVLVIVLCVLVGVILLSVMFPLLGIMSGL